MAGMKIATAGKMRLAQAQRYKLYINYRRSDYENEHYDSSRGADDIGILRLRVTVCVLTGISGRILQQTCRNPNQGGCPSFPFQGQ